MEPRRGNRGNKEYARGQRIPGTQYRFVRRIGEGGHGTVCLVEHTFLEASAVMKLLHADLVERRDITERMKREARMLAKLRHPNLVEVRDGGITRESPSRPYFVMERLDGMSLRALLANVRGSVGVLPALRLAIGVLDGLEHAHRAGVVHRDVKPDNVFIHRTSTDLTVPKVIDFGIAHLLLGTARTGARFLGTPRYAAPEQLLGEAPTAKTDIYAVGLVLWELITGVAPFAYAKDATALVAAHFERKLPPASTLAPDVPRALDGYLASMTARDPAERPPTAFAAAVALREVRERMELRAARESLTPDFKTQPTPLENLLLEARSDLSEPTRTSTPRVATPPEAPPTEAQPTKIAAPPPQPIAIARPRPTLLKKLAAVACGLALVGIPTIIARLL